MLRQQGQLASGQLWKAGAIVDYARETVETFYKLFDDLAKKRGRGTTSNVEQDLLRAMVVFAGAGLDALLKQIVKDAMPDILKKSQAARDSFQKFAVRYLCRTADGTDDLADPLPSLKRIASLMTSSSPRDALVELLVEERISHSLQSGDELRRTVAVLGISDQFKLNTNLFEAFDVRNDIIHEMDIAFTGTVGRRNRKQRSKAKMTEYATALHNASVSVIELVDKVLSG